jgi:hypothetical protein
MYIRVTYRESFALTAPKGFALYYKRLPWNCTIQSSKICTILGNMHQLQNYNTIPPGQECNGILVFSGTKKSYWFAELVQEITALGPRVGK